MTATASAGATTAPDLTGVAVV
ncbi:MAG: hypothetical protein QOC80_1374, partial [Frankiaceae bacterium]|nr:hypothetical protein [Frankiaceae bacterium]